MHLIRLLTAVVCLGHGMDLLACDFDCTLNRHLDAIQQKDFVAFESTLTRGERLTFILPNGQLFTDPGEFRAMLKDWFADTSWTFDYDIIAVQQAAGMGSALLLVRYDEPDRDGQPYHLDHYLNLVFKYEGDGWYLVHDQNTIARLPQPTQTMETTD